MAYRYRRRRAAPPAVQSLMRWEARSVAAFAVLALVALLTLAGLALLGRSYTSDGRVLSWIDWRALQAGQIYRAELDGLQQDAGALVELLNSRVPDPVRAQIVADQIAARHGSGQPALARHRDLLAQAAAAVEEWAIGAATRDAAQQAIDELMTALGEADERDASR